MQRLLSLKNSCRSRLATQTSPCLSQKSFLLSDFMSSEFVDYLMSHYNDQFPHYNISDPGCLLELIEAAHQTFEVTKNQIEVLQREFVQKLTAFYTKDDQKETLDLLQLEMKKCHQKIRENPELNLRLIDDFALLLKEFEDNKNRNEKYIMEEKKKEILCHLNSISEELHTAVVNIAKSHDKTELWRLKKVMKSRECSNQPLGDHQTKKIMDLKTNLDDLCCSSTIMSVSNQDIVLFAAQRPTQRIQTKMIDTKAGRILSSSKNLFDDMRIYKFERNFLRANSLNILLSECRAQDFRSVVRVFRINSRGTMRRIVELPLDAYFLIEEHIFFIDILKDQHLLAVAGGQELKLINLFTRRVTQTFKYAERIRGIRCIEDLSFLVVVFSSHLLVYDLSTRLKKPAPKFQCGIQGQGWDKVFLQANLIITIEFISDVVRDEEGIIIENNSMHIFTIFQVNQLGINRFEVTLKALDLYQSINENDFEEEEDDMNPNYISIGYILTYPNVNKLKILYSVGSSSMVSIKEINFGHQGRDVEQDLLLERNSPLIYCQGRELLMDRTIM